MKAFFPLLLTTLSLFAADPPLLRYDSASKSAKPDIGVVLPWQGVIWSADGKPMKGTAEKWDGKMLRFVSAGTAYNLSFDKLHPVSRGELGIGNEDDHEAYLSDLPRRQKLADKARADKLAAIETQTRIIQLQRERGEQAKADAKAAEVEMRRRAERERELQALETLAREAELLRIQRQQQQK